MRTNSILFVVCLISSSHNLAVTWLAAVLRRNLPRRLCRQLPCDQLLSAALILGWELTYWDPYLRNAASVAELGLRCLLVVAHAAKTQSSVKAGVGSVSIASLINDKKNSSGNNVTEPEPEPVLVPAAAPATLGPDFGPAWLPQHQRQLQPDLQQICSGLG
eukprot:Skav226501  [mRNA]  locus=scaffold4305:108429:121513:- [translate_table: standard]